MKEELDEILGLVKREGGKSILATLAIVLLATFSYRHFSSDEEEQDVPQESSEIKRSIASFEKTSFQRKLPSVDISKLEKEVLAKEKEIDRDNRFDETESYEKTPEDEPSQGIVRSFEENQEIFQEEYQKESDNIPDTTDEPISKDNPDLITSNGACIGPHCPPLNPPSCELTNTCEKVKKSCEELGTCSSPQDNPEENPKVCTPSMIVFPDQGPGTYSTNPTVGLFSPDSKDIYYCVTSIPGSCDPEPNVDGISYNGSFDIGASEGSYILSFLANEDSCAKKYRYSYEVDSTKPDVQVSLGSQYLQTTERIQYQMNSNNAGDPTHYFWLLKLAGATEFTSCKTTAESFSLNGFGLDLFISDSSPDEADLNTLPVPYNLDYSPKSLLNYGKVGSQFISIVSDRSSGSPTSFQYGCRLNHVFLVDFPIFDFKTTFSHPVNAYGEIPFMGSFNSFDSGRFPSSTNEAYLEVGFENITN